MWRHEPPNMKGITTHRLCSRGDDHTESDLGARAERAHGEDVHAERKKCEVKGRNLEDVWGENKRGVTFGEFEDYGEVRG